MCRKILLSSFAAITIALAGAVSAQNAAITGDGNEPFSAADPVPNAEAQAKTEKMLKEESAEIYGDGGPSSAADPVPDAEAQAKTEKMLKEDEKMLQGN